MENSTENLMFNVSVGPQSVADDNTRRLMIKVIIALLPTTIWGIYVFGVEALITIGLCIISAVLFEYLYCKIMKLDISIGDFSAVVTGLLLGLNLTSTIPWWICVIGSFVAIVIAKILVKMK